ncbi:uncharacterized protein YlxW (UPF0749 family) [Branchiibius hedensis]|uniref:Uncharacterized conserved protein YlxW, UPF0749 family n=1 Tax=Branchiibius hedensis TaxID=672460 RepID=A0A2Y9BTD4_9MICO|nr:DUF881 domain-containing protein [Branchiibius hedensis]PWJ25047.1 uncharacterized protein YlxW (UPF0749 family) [Branchiibius hedensis]SSA33862.1 Uncharacterized conserved protein YlxW, UPF0749 family [Branchiibius hedensis]
MTEHDPEATRPEHRPHHAMHRKRPARRATAGPTSLGEPLVINPAQDAADAHEPPADPPSSAWRTLARMGRPRATKANLFAALLAVLLGFGITTQIQQTDAGGLEDLRQDELVALLDSVNSQAARLEQEADRLTTTRDELKNSTGDAAALQAAKERLEMLGVLNGTLPATGPGIIITIQDNEKGVQAANLLDTVEELRDAGAEAIQINDQRVIVSTWFGGSSDTGLTVSGHTIRAPYTILAIGDPHTMSTAMAIPGGVVESLRSMGAAATVTSSQQVKVTALQPAQTPQYAQPEPSATAKESS